MVHKTKNLRHIASLAILLVGVATIVILAMAQTWRLENEVYLSYFDSPELYEENEGVLVMSWPSTCNASGNEIDGASPELVSAFFEANASAAKPIRLSSLESLIDVVTWSDAKKFHKNELPPVEVVSRRLQRVQNSSVVLFGVLS